MSGIIGLQNKGSIFKRRKSMSATKHLRWCSLLLNVVFCLLIFHCASKETQRTSFTPPERITVTDLFSPKGVQLLGKEIEVEALFGGMRGLVIQSDSGWQQWFAIMPDSSFVLRTREQREPLSSEVVNAMKFDVIYNAPTKLELEIGHTIVVRGKLEETLEPLTVEARAPRKIIAIRASSVEIKK
jgi:hypothetical protein